MMRQDLQFETPLGDDLMPIEVHDIVANEQLALSTIDLFNNYSHIFVAAFLTTLIITPIVRRAAMSAGVVDLPDEARKMHQQPTPYLGGLAIFIGLIVALLVSYFFSGDAGDSPGVPLAIIVGMCAITFTGVADDIWGWDPRLKVAGQLVAAAALAVEDVGVHVAEGFLKPLFGAPSDVLVSLAGMEILNENLYYWVGTFLIAIFVLGGCNSANLLDGLDGLLTGVVAIATVGLLLISLLLASETNMLDGGSGQSTLMGARIVLCVALLGTLLGFLPHNFNPASIFLGDGGSLLLGYMCVVIILMLGEFGETHLVIAGLIIFSLPIMDTMLAIIRRKLANKAFSEADQNHIHHQLFRALGTVKRAVLSLYGIGIAFCVLGVTLASLVMQTPLRVRVIYVIFLVLFGIIVSIAIKAAQSKKLDESAGE